MERLNQTNELENEFEQIHPVAKRVDMLNVLAWQLRYTDKEKALRLSQSARQLSQSGEYQGQPYLPGLVTALATSGFVYQAQFKLEESLNDSIQAMTLMEGLPLLPAACDARCSIAWVKNYSGEASTALDYALPAVQIARELKDLEREVFALDLLACCYAILNDMPDALEQHLSVLQMLPAIESPAIHMIVYNNHAVFLNESERYEEGYEFSLKSINLAREHGFADEEIIFISTLVISLTMLGKYTQAETILRETLNKIKGKTGTKPHSYLVQTLGMLYYKNQDYQQAETNYLLSLEIASKNNLRIGMEQCHAALSEIYEKLDQPANALKHYKQYFAFHTNNANIENGRKIALLKTEHQMEHTRREADQYRIKNQELEHEVEAGRHEAAMYEKLAMIDPLTELFNRRHFSILANQELEHSLAHRHPFAVLFLDIDHFKSINDRYGHLSGDRVLVSVASTIKTVLRDSDIIGRFGGEEFIATLPETPLQHASQIGERIRKTISQTKIDIGHENISVTVSIGITELIPSDMLNPHMSMTDLVHKADQALYIAKQNGRNRVEVYSKPASDFGATQHP
jgi:diguanylate cyclase (GGDEF)-like protein